MMTLNFTGQWTGTITYGKEYNQLKGKELFFDLVINQDGNNITGTAKDTGGVGVNPDEALIAGTINEGRIDFVKQYSSFHYFDMHYNTKNDKSKPGPEIDYTGIYNELENKFSGYWTIRGVFKLFWIIPISYKNTGTWIMHRK